MFVETVTYLLQSKIVQFTGTNDAVKLRSQY